MHCWFWFFEKTKIGTKEPPPVPVISKNLNKLIKECWFYGWLFDYNFLRTVVMSPDNHHGSVLIPNNRQTRVLICRIACIAGDGGSGGGGWYH
jgi:hypothetical protein